MIQRRLYPFLLLCFCSVCTFTLSAQKSKSYDILQPEPVLPPPTNPQFALGGLSFITLSDGSSVFHSPFYGKNALVHGSKSSNMPWAKIIGFENRDVYPTIAATPDGGFLVNMTITRTATERISKFILAKFNAQNVLQWTKIIKFDENETTSLDNYDFSVGTDGNILLTGTVKELNTAAAKFFYLFLNADGERIRSFYVNEFHKDVSVCSRFGGGFAAIASIDSTSRSKYRFMLFDAQGQLVSSKTYQGDQNFYSNGIELAQKPNGGFAGVSSSGIIEFDNEGNYLTSLFINRSIPTSFGYSINPPIYFNTDGRFILQGTLIKGFSGNSGFFVYNNAITAHYLEGEANTALHVSANDNGGINLSTSSFRSNVTVMNPPLKVFQYAINPAFDRTDCGLSISKATIPSTTSNLVRTNRPELVATNLNPIITTITNSSLQLTDFNVSHSLSCPSVGVNEADLESTINISPNPSSSVFWLKPNSQTTDLQRLTVYNNLGQVVLDNKESNWETPLSMEQSGTYIVKIQTNVGSILKKIVKVD
jgi:Secretion system C-terminal sorting domain